MNNEQIWQAALGEIELSLSKANFITWFKNTFISEFNDTRVILCVPNIFTKKWLETKYHKQIIEALENVSKQKIKTIDYKVETGKSKNNTNVEQKTNTQETKMEEPTRNEVKTNKFGLNDRYTFENFIVGKGNELAYAACKAVVNDLGRAYNPLFIYGGVGLGKTHLLQAIGNAASKKTNKILYITSEKFTNHYIQSIQSGKAKDFKNQYRNVDILLVDDVQFMAGKDGTQEEFFHTFNELQQENKQIVLTSDRPPQSIPAIEKRLISRFQSGMVADVGKPDIETKIAILEQKAKSKGLTLSSDILEYIANNVKNNVRELEGALNRLVAISCLTGRVPELPDLRKALSDILTNYQSQSLSPHHIIESVANFYKVSIKDLVGKARQKELVWCRQVAIYLIRKELGTSYPAIAQEMGGRDHTTAMHAYTKVEQEVNTNEKAKQELESIKQLFPNTGY